jgi:hypothetical protein
MVRSLAAIYDVLSSIPNLFLFNHYKSNIIVSYMIQ